MSRWRWLLTGVLFTGGAVWLAIQVLVQGQAARDDASTYGAFALALLGLLVPVLQGVARRLIATVETPDLDRLTDDLAAAVLAQWDQAAQDRELLPHPLPIRWRRSTQPVAGRVSDATRPGPAAMDPLPGIERVTARQLQQGTYRMLHTIYGGLASGRLILLGAPGAGKSAAAILLLRDALRYRDQHDPADRARIPVPVLFTLHGWDPSSTPVRDWITTTLTTQIPLLAHRRHRGHAAPLLSTGRIAVFLDGLDEIPEPLRVHALDALSTQTTFRLVLLTRTSELVTAAQQHTLTGAVALELQPLTPADAQDHLRQPLTEPPPPPWRHLFAHLADHPDSPLADALATPLTITLLRAIYPPTRAPGSPVGQVDELLDTTRFPQPDDITHYLLDHAITVAYTPRPGHLAPPYAPDTAYRTLALIAVQLRDTHTRDLAWWSMPDWLPRAPRALIGLLALLVGVLAMGLVFGLVFGLAVLVIGRVPRNARPRVVRRVLWRRVLSRANLVRGLVGGLAVGLVGGLRFGLRFGLMIGLIGGLMIGLVGGLMDGLMGEPADVLGAKRVQRSNLAGGLVVGVTAGLAGGLAAGLVGGLLGGLVGVLLGGLLGVLIFDLVGVLLGGLAVGLVFGLVGGLLGGLAGSTAGRVWICQIYLRVRHRTPLRLMRFLEDARARHVLRTVGAIYQFRHATLQDRLAPPAVAGLEDEHDGGVVGEDAGSGPSA